MTPRVAIYARFSSELQREASIEDQIRVCTALASREGWSLVQTYTDYAISGATALRPGYQALLADARAGRFDVVIAESLDRLSRDQEHIAAFFKQVTFAGIPIVTLAEGPISELHVGLKGTMSAPLVIDDVWREAQLRPFLRREELALLYRAAVGLLAPVIVVQTSRTASSRGDHEAVGDGGAGCEMLMTGLSMSIVRTPHWPGADRVAAVSRFGELTSQAASTAVSGPVAGLRPRSPARPHGLAKFRAP
jgi:hypothetical protein